jgi:predicted ATPase
MQEFQKFPEKELNTLLDELRQAGLDSFQAGELLLAFLKARGYGADAMDARVAASRLEPLICTLPRLQEALERLAWVV